MQLINIYDIHRSIQIVSQTCGVLISWGPSQAGSRVGLNVISLRVSGFLYWSCFLGHSKYAWLCSSPDSLCCDITAHLQPLSSQLSVWIINCPASGGFPETNETPLCTLLESMAGKAKQGLFFVSLTFNHSTVWIRVYIVKYKYEFTKG